MALKRRNKVDVTFNMSSMTDIVFLLLVFFIVLSTIISPFGHDVVLPSGIERHKTPNQFTITITKEPKFLLNDVEMDITTLEATLKTKMIGIEKPGISIKADEMVPHGFVVQIMNIAARNKYSVVISMKAP